MSDETRDATPAELEQERLDAEAKQQHARMLDIAVRHLYGTALTLCRLTGGNMSDVPRILVAAGAHSVQSLLEKLALQQRTIERLDAGDNRRQAMVDSANNLAGDLSMTMNDFEGALIEALGNMKELRELEPDGSMPVEAGDEPAPGPKLVKH